MKAVCINCQSMDIDPNSLIIEVEGDKIGLCRECRKTCPPGEDPDEDLRDFAEIMGNIEE